MPTLSFSFNTGTVPVARIIDAFAKQYRYANTVHDASGMAIPNPESKAEFARRMLKDHIKAVVTAAEASDKAEIARKQAIADADIGLT